jgi:hypothetical protein
MGVSVETGGVSVGGGLADMRSAAAVVVGGAVDGVVGGGDGVGVEGGALLETSRMPLFGARSRW